MLTEPGGIDITYRAIHAARTNTTLDLFSWLFRTAQLDARLAATPKTVERINSGGLRVIFTADPQNLKAILATQFQDFGKGDSFYQDWHEFLGSGIFSVDGKLWSQSRALIRPMFVKERVADLDILERHVSKLIAVMKEEGTGGGEAVEVKDLFYRYTLDAITEFLFGRSVDSLEHANAEFAGAFSEIQQTQNIIARAG